MNLTYYTNYSLRVMIYLGVHSSSLASISQISESFGISRNHLIKVVHNLAKRGFIKTTRGRGGGLRLARDPKEIVVGDVVRATEPSFNLVECFDSCHNTCPITPVCELKNIIVEARQAFMAVLDNYTLADLLGKRKQMATLLKIVYSRQSPLWVQAANGRRSSARQRM